MSELVTVRDIQTVTTEIWMIRRQVEQTALYGQVQEDWNKLHGAWIKAAAADAATGEKLRTAARALAEKWRKEEW